MWPIVMLVKEVGESESCIVMMQIQVVPDHESEPTSDWSPIAREFKELYLRRKANGDLERD